MTLMLDKFYYKIYKNQKIPSKFKEEDLEYVVNYKPRPSDRFVVTYPKCGTSWTQQIIRLILNSGKLEDNDKSFFDRYFFERVGPKFWTNYNSDTSVRPEDPVIIKSHLNHHLLPYNTEAKYLMVLRNPKDVCVSLYYHCIQNDRYFDDFHDFFKYFISGNVSFGDYFEYVLGYWQHRYSNFTFLVYEQMLRQLKDSVVKIAEFLGEKYVNELFENNEKLLNDIIKGSTFDRMKEFHENDFHFRKGIAGDWKTHLTEEESDLIDGRVEEVFSGTGLELLWKEEMKW